MPSLIPPKPIKASRSGHEHQEMSAEDLPALERKIAAVLKAGWIVRSRGHSSDGIHSASLIRSNAEAVKA